MPGDYDYLSELRTQELSKAIAAKFREFRSLPRQRNGLCLVGLLNRHFGEDKLLCDEIPADATVPHRYEGDWRSPARGLTPEPTRREAVWMEDEVLKRFGDCSAIYA
jgi:hypothetical protein